MEKNAFFKEATLRICGNLEIHKAMHACLAYMRDTIPVDAMYMELFEKKLSSMRVIAKATKDGGRQMNTLVHLPEHVLEALRKDIAGFNYESGLLAWKVNDPDANPVAHFMLQTLDEKMSSVLGNILLIEDQPFGTLICMAHGKDRYTDQHLAFFDLLREPFYIALSNALAHREVLELKELLADDNRYLHGELRRLSGDEIIGAEFGLKNVMFKVQQVATLNSPVLLLGETGTGKDLIAKSIHYASSRSDGPFVSVNCGAIPDSLIDSELFGHEKGAFTGALSQKRGRFERANKGTIFLDEIGELPLQAQVRLLRVLQNKQIERVGGVATIPLDIRVIAATNRNLEEMIKDQLFREDLWFRINVFPIWMPPLRERRSDIPALVQYFISLKSKELKLSSIPNFSPGTIDLLMDYHWPGNVRELQNLIERALILNPLGPLAPEHFSTGLPMAPEKLAAQNGDTDHLDDMISRHIRRVLSKTKGRVSGKNGAARLLGINPSTLRNRMNKLGINYRRIKES